MTSKQNGGRECVAYFKVKLYFIQAFAQKSVQEKESIISVRYGSTNLSLGSLFGITRQSLVMPNSDPWDRFVDPYLTLISDSYILIFALKHRLWVLVRTASLIYVLSKNKKNSTIFHLKITTFTAVKYCSILHGHVCVMMSMESPCYTEQTTNQVNDVKGRTVYGKMACQIYNIIIEMPKNTYVHSSINLKFTKYGDQNVTKDPMFKATLSSLSRQDINSF